MFKLVGLHDGILLFSQERLQAVLLLVQAVPVWDLHGHLWTRHFLVGAIGLGIFLILVPVGLVLARQRGASPALGGAGAVVALAAVVAIGWPKSDASRICPTC